MILKLNTYIWVAKAIITTML